MKQRLQKTAAALIAAATLCAGLPAITAAAASPLTYDASTKTLTITGAITRNDLAPYRWQYDEEESDEEWDVTVYEPDYPVKSVVAESGAVLPADSKDLFELLTEPFNESAEHMTLVDLSKADFSQVTNAEGMFQGIYADRFDLSGIDTSNITEMDFMFYDCKTGDLDLSSFDTHNVTSMYVMFNGFEADSLDLSSFDVRNVTNMTAMFRGCKVDTLDLSGFRTDSLKKMDNMFSGCKVKNLDIRYFNTSKVDTMSGVFNGCTADVLDLSSFDTSNVYAMTSMFSVVTCATIYVGDKWTTAKVSSDYDMFFAAKNLVGGNGTTYDNNHTDSEYARIDTESTPGYLTYKKQSSPLRYDADTQTLTIFGPVTAADTLPYHGYYQDSKYVEPEFVVKHLVSDDNAVFPADCKQLFYMMTKLEDVDFTKGDFSKVQDATQMFYGSGAKTIDITAFDTRSLTNTTYMFAYNTSLETIIVGDEWDMTNVTESSGMFLTCTNIVGGYGQTYDSTHTDKLYARIDKDGVYGYLTAGFETYTMKIAGVQVTSLKANDILGDGVFRYDAANNTLIVKGDATYSGSVIEAAIPDLTIRIDSDSVLTSTGEYAIKLGEDTTITGKGKLTTNGYYDSIYFSASTLRILDLTLDVNGKRGISDSNYGNLTIENSNVHIVSTDGALMWLKNYGMIDCSVTSPSNYWFEYYCLYDKSDDTIAKEVVIEPYALEITQQPKSASGFVGDTVYYTVWAAGAGLSYQWQYYDGTWHNTSMSGAKTDTLSVPVIAARNGLKYRCIVTDRNGKTAKSNAASLTVLPQITAQPKAVAAKVGETAKFSVTATGAGLTYQWQYYDGTWHDTSLTGAKTATLSVPAIMGRNGLKYRCIITDANGTVVKSNAVKLTVTAAAPKITAQPSSQHKYIGQTATFTVAAEGEGLTYQWQYYDTAWHNTSLTGAKTATLSVPVIAGRNGLKYHCIVTNEGGSVTSDEATLIVDTQITAQPEHVDAYIGDTAKFSVAAAGAGLNYQWQWRSNGGEWKDTTMTGAKTATLSVPVIAGRNGLEYRCVITDANSIKAYSAVVVLTVLPKITAQPKAVSAAVGETAKFSVTASGAGLTYQWQYYDSTWHNTSMTGAKTATLSVPVIAGRNGLKYRCIITDANGAVVKSNAVKLTVLPTITAQPKAVTTTAGSTAKFTVTATGAGLTYQWQYYNPKTDTWADTTLTGAKTATLSVGATTGRNGLSYHCVITDANDKTLTSDAALLTVK